MTFNSVVTLILGYITEFYSFADYVTVVEDGPIMSSHSYIWPKLTHA